MVDDTTSLDKPRSNTVMDYRCCQEPSRILIVNFETFGIDAQGGFDYVKVMALCPVLAG